MTLPLVLARHAPGEYAPHLLAAGAAAYGACFWADAASTAAFGREAVGRHERAPVFRFFFARRGGRVAVPVQAAMEACIALLLLPALLAPASWLAMSGAALCAFGLVHALGWRANAAPGAPARTNRMTSGDVASR